jgi:two-component system phosphate regulon sensor histidine kinase PhoR
MKALTVFYILVIYIFLQFCWWAFLLADLNKEVYKFKLENHKYSHEYHVQEDLLNKLHHRWFMIAGEGVVFLSFLILGAVKTHKAFQKEMRLSQRQKNFLLSVSHELKSPLASIKLYLQTLQKHDLDKQKTQSFIENALIDTERLNVLVDNVLTATKIEQHSQFFIKEVINFSTCVKEIVDKFIHGNRNSHVFELNCMENIYLQFDKQALSSVLINLLENAQKYAPPLSLIRVSLKQEQNKIILQVADEGGGIAENEKISIFEKFYRIGNEETRKSKGTGLGLFIVKYIVENHNGKIHVKNNLTQGSIFECVFTIPS